MQSKLRSAINRICRTIEDTFAFTLGGTPSTQNFGDSASEGTSESPARVDHRHGMADLPEDTLDNLDSHAFYFNDLWYSLATLDNTVDFSGTVTLGGRDVPGETGAIGSVDVASSTAANTGSAFWIAQNSSGSTVTQDVYAPRLRRLEIRAMPHTATAGLTTMVSVIGAFRTSSNARADLTTDGIFFRLDTSVSANWFAVVRVGSADSYAADTGVAPRNDGSGNVKFDTFRIDYDGTTAVFYIGNDANGDGHIEFTQVGSTTVTLPGTSNKLCGYGVCTSHSDAGTSRTLVCDYVLIDGLRSAL